MIMSCKGHGTILRAPSLLIKEGFFRETDRLHGSFGVNQVLAFVKILRLCEVDWTALAN